MPTACFPFQEEVRWCSATFRRLVQLDDVFYAHYDGTSLDPKEWTTPPYAPVFRNGRVEDGASVVARPPAGSPIDPEWRVYARSAADDKAPIVAMFAALDAMRAAGVAPKSNIQFVFDGEEEAGSPSLEKTLVANRALFAPNSVWLMCNETVYQTREPLIVFGTRGVMTLDLTAVPAAIRVTQRTLRKLGA